MPLATVPLQEIREQSISKSLNVYSSLMTDRILLLMEMMVLSAATAACERSFSTMNILKTNMKTNTQYTRCERVHPGLTVDLWVDNGSGTKHYTTYKLCLTFSSSYSSNRVEHLSSLHNAN